MADLKENLMTGLFGEEPYRAQSTSSNEPDIEIDIDQLLDFHSEIVPGKNILGVAFLKKKQKNYAKVLQCMAFCNQLSFERMSAKVFMKS